MIHPDRLIRWGALGAVALLVRAITREAREQRSVILLPPPGATPRRRARRRPMVHWDHAEEPAGPPSAR
ncbi:hypothetical protein HNP73_000382 [Amaricoccus macauensis]|uniref:Uncharacterized protein n=1 Tax=Amaricoccus macauensis TaxID=57001 RepID=A0A840SM82_9RHOB|nr:hypothetical protein [Amaricoccus macauensis]